MELSGVSQGRQNNLSTITKDTLNIDVKRVEGKEVDNSIKKQYTEKDIEKAVNKLNNFLEDENTHAEYEVHDKLNTLMIKIIDNNSKEVLMEVPPEKILDMVAKLCELVGVVFDKKA